MKIIIAIYFTLITLSHVALAQTSNEIIKIETSHVSHRIYLVGDSGTITDHTPILWKKIKTQIAESKAPSTIVFLGDNVYPKGLVSSNNSNYQTAKKVLDSYYQNLKGFNGNIVFVPGNHDWDNTGFDGYKNIRRQGSYLKQKFGRQVLFPKSGCPGPEEFDLTDDLTLIAIDTQWILHPHVKPTNGMEDCDSGSLDEFLLNLEKIILRNKDKNVVVSAHHPIHSSGSHGGKFPSRDSVFPLTNYDKRFIIPLPVIGWIYPLYRRYIGNIQDIVHPDYQDMIQSFKRIFSKHDRLLYSSGHEHTLEYSEFDNIHQIVSGSFAKSTYSKKTKENLFNAQLFGYARLDVQAKGRVNISYFGLGSDEKVENIYDRTIFPNFKREELKFKVSKPRIISDWKPSFVSVSADSSLNSKGIKTTVLGSNNRAAWTDKVRVPIFEIDYVMGGFIIERMGGGQQTRSLKLKNKDGRRYTLRSIEKYTKNLLPERAKGTVAENLVKDKISSSHPYGAFAMPILADAVGVLHTHPKLYYVSDGSDLGNYGSLFQNTLCMLEEDLGGSWKGAKQYNSPEDVIDTIELFDLYLENDSVEVDQRAYLRARLLDILVSDWDRHGGQWKWGIYKENTSLVARPIPEDRDHVFFKSNGFLSSFVQGLGFLNKFQSFDEEISNVVSLSQQAKPLDQKFLNQLTWSDWQKELIYFREELSLEVLAKAVSQMPNDDAEKKNIVDKLSKRLSQIEIAANILYRNLNREVTVFARDTSNIIRITSLDEGRTLVDIKSRITGAQLYQKKFDSKATQKVLINAGKGADRIILGDGLKSDIKFVLIGGEGLDRIEKQGTLNLTNKPVVVDDPRGIVVDVFLEYHNEISGSAYVHDQKYIQKNKRNSELYFGYKNSDNYGSALDFVYDSQDRSPYSYARKSQNHLEFEQSLVGLGAQIHASKEKQLGNSVRSLFFELDSTVPYQTRNFFGLGNNTGRTMGTDFYRHKYLSSSAFSALKYYSSPKLAFGLGPKASIFNLKNAFNQGRIVQSNSENNFNELSIVPNSSDVLESNVEIGYRSFVHLKKLDRNIQPRRGIDFKISFDHLWYASGPNSGRQRQQLSVDLKTYAEITKINSVFNFDLGYQSNYSDWSYFHAARLGYSDNLRGFLEDRYAGKSKVYGSVGLNKELARFKTFIAPMKIGMKGFFDTGKVTPNLGRKDFHRGYGLGIWLRAWKAFHFNVEYSLGGSKELDDGILFVQTGILL